MAKAKKKAVVKKKKAGAKEKKPSAFAVGLRLLLPELVDWSEALPKKHYKNLESILGRYQYLFKEREPKKKPTKK